MRLAAAALITATQALVAPTPQKPSTRLHGRANKLVIWDCDGVLVDSEALLKRAEVDALKAAGFDDVDEDACNRLFSGFAPEAGAVNFEKEYGKPLPEHFFRDQIANSQDLFRKKLEALNGATVRTLHAAGRQQVVASGSPRDRVDVPVPRANDCERSSQMWALFRISVASRRSREPRPSHYARHGATARCRRVLLGTSGSVPGERRFHRRTRGRRRRRGSFRGRRRGRRLRRCRHRNPGSPRRGS